MGRAASKPLADVTALFAVASEIAALAAVFMQVADSLKPHDWEEITNKVRHLIEMHAKEIWPHCTVKVHGSVARDVHNYDSDIDILIAANKDNFQESEFVDLCQRLKHEPLVNFVSSGSDMSNLLYQKSVKIRVDGVEIDVAIQERFGVSLYTRDVLEDLDRAYKTFPSLPRAVGMAKRIFRELKGVEVEYVMHTLHKQLQEDELDRWCGFFLFVNFCENIQDFENSLPFRKLLNHARAQSDDSVKWMGQRLEQSRQRNYVQLLREEIMQRKRFQITIKLISCIFELLAMLNHRRRLRSKL